MDGARPVSNASAISPGHRHGRAPHHRENRGSDGADMGNSMVPVGAEGFALVGAEAGDKGGVCGPLGGDLRGVLPEADVQGQTKTRKNRQA